MDEAFVRLVQLVARVLFRPVRRDEGDLPAKTRAGGRRSPEEVLPSQTRTRADSPVPVGLVLRHVERNFFRLVELLVVEVGLKDGFDVGGEEVELILGVTLDGEVFAAVLAEVARAGRREDRPSS